MSEESFDGGNDHADSTAALLHRLKLAAPVLSMDFCPASAPIFGDGSRGLLLAGGMDGGSHLISIDWGGSRSGDNDGGEGGAEGEERKNGVALLASMKNHAKYVVVCRWEALNM